MTPHPITTDFGNHPLPKRTDVLVIGSGYTGTVTALQLRKSGVDVTVIDQERVGSQASAKNGGMALTGLSTSLYKLLRKAGREKMIRFYQESLESIDWVERLVMEGNIDCHFKRSGVLQAAFKPAHMEGLKQDQEFLARHLNHTTILIPADRIQEELGTDRYYGGLLETDSAGLHPAKYIAGLVKMAAESGVEFHSHVAAQKIIPLNGKYQVHTTQGIVLADQVVVGTNGYTTNLTPWQMRRVVPVESFMIATEELPGEVVDALIPKDRIVFDSKRFLYYFRLSPDRKRFLFGGRPKKFWRSVPDKAADMRQDMVHVFPQLTDFAIDFAWSGKVCFTVDHMPIIGSHNGVHYAMGYCGHGVGMATYFGVKLADMVLGKGLNTVFAHKKSIPIPLYTGKPWFLPLAHGWFRLLDKVS